MKNPRNKEIEEIRRHTPKFSNVIVAEVRKQIHEAIKEIKKEIVYYVKKDMITKIMDLLIKSKLGLDLKNIGTKKNDRNYECLS